MVSYFVLELNHSAYLHEKAKLLVFKYLADSTIVAFRLIISKDDRLTLLHHFTGYIWVLAGKTEAQVNLFTFSFVCHVDFCS